MTTIQTQYANTDFDLKSKTPFETLQSELSASCCLLHYTHGDDGNWHACVEANHDENQSTVSGAARDVAAILNAIENLTVRAREELATCYLREFNIGFECWDSWAYLHRVPTEVVRAVADAECSIAVTLYPMRKPDGSPRE